MPAPTTKYILNLEPKFEEGLCNFKRLAFSTVTATIWNLSQDCRDVVTTLDLLCVKAATLVSAAKQQLAHDAQ